MHPVKIYKSEVRAIVVCAMLPVDGRGRVVSCHLEQNISSGMRVQLVDLSLQGILHK